jgi:uncharacterized protein
MAMTMTGEIQLAAPREVVWAKLNDPSVLKSCIPDCEERLRLGSSTPRLILKTKQVNCRRQSRWQRAL